LEPLEKRFVCVRLLTINDIDLGMFQFDYDLTWCVFFLNADGTIYGRYGTRAGGGKDSTTHVSVASFRKTMRRVLDLHRGYPANKALLAGKRGPKPEYRTPKEVPILERHHCIECHQVREGVLRSKWQEKRLTAADVWDYPLPENVGLTMDVDDGLRVKAVAAGSPAAQAGVAVGDDLVALDGQRLVSQADVQWVLHGVGAEARLVAALDRGGKELRATLVLRGPWREADLSWRRSTGLGLRYGLLVDPLSAAEKRRRDVPADGLALRVKAMAEPRAAPLVQAGLRVGDVIVAVDGKGGAMTESRFLAYVRLHHPRGDRVRLTVLRDNERRVVTVPMW
jgi:hypothetical protein